MAKSSRKRRQSTASRPASTPVPPQAARQSSTPAAQAPARERPRRQRRAAQEGPLQRYRTAIIAAGVGVAILIVAFVFLQQGGKAYACDSQLQPNPSQTSDPNALGSVTQDLGNAHVPAGSKTTYDFCPPTSGSHYATTGRGPIRDAIYNPANEQAPGGWVHNLEHGAVVLLYRCPSGTLGSGDCATADEMAQMQRWFDGAPVVNNCPKQAVVARFDEMATRFAVLSWDRALLVDTFDLAQASAFAQQWTDVTAPEAERLVCS